MEKHVLHWHADNLPLEISYDLRGDGRPVLLLPALSTVSTRQEVWPLADALGSGFRRATTDWPGFGEVQQPRLDYRPAIMLDFLEDFTKQVFGTERPAVVAAGHGAGYALALAARRPGIWRKLALVAPTWRGPLPTMMDGYRPLQRRMRTLGYLPLVGPLLYRLNVSRPIVRMMYRRHVYSQPGTLGDDRLHEKLRIARRPGGRYGSFSFVTGALDPMRSREQFLLAVRDAGAPVLVVTAPQIPRRSSAEIDAAGSVPGVTFCRAPAGALGVHEEFPGVVGDLVRPFLLG